MRQKMRQRTKQWLLTGITASLVVGILVLVLWMHNVPTDLTDEDRQAISTLLDAYKDPSVLAVKAGTYEGEIAQIDAVQQAVLAAVPVNRGIPLGLSREPGDVLSGKEGLCYDRSRVIEKALQFLGYETRHISIYEKPETILKSLFTPGISSHAVSEVRTSKGWLVVDSNKLWLSLDHNFQPVSIKTIRESVAAEEKIDWLYSDEERSSIYDSPFLYVLGLFSRHGRFYEPMTPIPDVNWPQFSQNFAEIL